MNKLSSTIGSVVCLAIILAGFNGYCLAESSDNSCNTAKGSLLDKDEIGHLEMLNGQDSHLLDQIGGAKTHFSLFYTVLIIGGAVVVTGFTLTIIITR